MTRCGRADISQHLLNIGLFAELFIMLIRVTALLAIVFGASCADPQRDLNRIVVTPQYCGPLAERGEYGVGFTGFVDGDYRRFATKGRASEVCPYLTEQTELIGTVELRCIVLDSDTECQNMKVFELSEDQSR